jgi:putative copper export protein/methionine-rich copper-binding protein CopC
MVRALAGLVAACLLSAPATVFAHGGLKSSVPAGGTVLGTAPKEIRLVFTEAVELAFTRVELRGPDGLVRLKSPAFAGGDRSTVLAPIVGPLFAGEYAVSWQIAGADGHPVRGNYKFSIAADADGLASAPPPAGSGARVMSAHHDTAVFPAAGSFDAESPLYVVIRWIQFASILVVTGAIAFHMFVLGLLRKRQRPESTMLASASSDAARVGFYAALLLASSAVIRLIAQSYAMHPSGSGFAPALMWAMIGGTTWGWGWLVQIIGAFAAIIGFFAARWGSRRGWIVATLGAVVGAFAPALSGHAASVPALRTVAILADGLHIIGASGWLGSLLVLLVAGIPAAMRLEKEERGLAVGDLVNAFSPNALAFAGLTVASGVFAAWLHLGAISELWQSQYGKTLMVKLAILGIVTATGAYNFLHVRPRLGRLDEVGHIKRSASIEVGVAVFVLLVTAVLVATPPAMDMTQRELCVPKPFC